MRKYVIGTGYHNSSRNSEEFYRNYWMPNTLKYASPEKIVVVNSGSPNIKTSDKEVWIDLTINPGHTDHMRATGDNSQFGGWTLSFINSALYAYSCKCDLIYKEQDCLAFGDWVGRAQKDIEDQQKSMLVGELVGFMAGQGNYELCLTYLKYEFILPFLGELLSIQQSDRGCFCETKFLMIGNKTNQIGRLSFGYGGNRPFNPKDDIFYIQKPRWWVNEKKSNPVGASGVPETEIKQLKEFGLLD